MFCIYCGAENPDDAIFCRCCGKQQHGGASTEAADTEGQPTAGKASSIQEPPSIPDNALERGAASRSASPSTAKVVRQPLREKQSRGISRRSVLVGLVGIAGLATAGSGIWWLVSPH